MGPTAGIAEKPSQLLAGVKTTCSPACSSAPKGDGSPVKGLNISVHFYTHPFPTEQKRITSYIGSDKLFVGEMFATTPRILKIVQDVLADPFALFIYWFILNEAIADIILAMSRSQPEDGDASNRPSSALSTCLHSLFLKVGYDSSCRHGSFHLSLPDNRHQNFHLFILSCKKESPGKKSRDFLV